MRILPSLVAALLLLASACSDDTMGYEPNCDDDSCDEQSMELVEFCRVDVGLTWACEDIDASVDLCAYDGNYRIGGGVVQINEKDGSVCNLNALSTCHALHVSASGEYLVCEIGSTNLAIGFDGVPLVEGGLELCQQLDHTEGYKGYFHDRKFVIGKEGAGCGVKSEAFDLPEDITFCHEVTISQQGMICGVGDNGYTEVYPFIE